MQNITNISILKKEKAPPLFEAESIEKIFLSQDDNFFLKRFQQNNYRFNFSCNGTCG